MPGFAELAARSHYSFLEGAASPRKMVETAARLGISALGLCDRNGLYGAVELIQAAKAQGIHPIIGTDLELAGGSRIRLLARSRTGYRQLCRAVSASQLAGVKGQRDWRSTGFPRAVWSWVPARARVRSGRVLPSRGPLRPCSGQLARAASPATSPSGSPGSGVSRPRPGPLKSRHPTLLPPERPASLRPTAGPFPQGGRGCRPPHCSLRAIQQSLIRRSSTIALR